MNEEGPRLCGRAYYETLYPVDYPEEGVAMITALTEGIDVFSAPYLRQVVRAVQCDERIKCTILGLGAISFIDSTGIGVFAGALKRALEGRSSIILRNLKPSIRCAFEQAGIRSDEFTIEYTEQPHHAEA